MIYIYAYYDNLGGFYGKPFFAPNAPEDFFTGLVQSLYGANKEALEGLIQSSICCLGTYDNITGVLSSEVQNLGSLSEVCTTIIAKKFAPVPGDHHEG